MSQTDSNGWSRSERFVIAELERLSAKMDAMDEKLSDLRVEVAQKGALWGALSATVVTVVGLLLR